MRNCRWLLLFGVLIFISVPAPSLAQNNIWDAIRSNFSMQPDFADPYYRRQLLWYRTHPKIVEQVFQRSAPYIYYIFQQTRKRHMPAEFALLPMVESGYNPNAYSSAGAAGLWQLTPVTASIYGLDINWWYDGRRDLLASTNVALNYLLSLHASFKNWKLAAAAYNAGESIVQSAISGASNQGSPAHLSDLPFPAQTRAYVPKLMALSTILRNPSQYGIRIPPVPNQPNFAVVVLGSQLDMKEMAALAGVSQKTIRRLNPGLLRFATEPTRKYALLIPVGHLMQFRQALASVVGRKHRSWHYHQVQAGETLVSIAHLYHTNSVLLQAINGMSSDDIHPNEGILVPLSLNYRFKGLARQMNSPNVKIRQMPSPTHNIAIQKNESLRSLVSKIYSE